MGATVIVASRSHTNCEETIQYIKAESRSIDAKNQLIAKSLDISDLVNVVEFSKWFLSNYSRLDFLVNNAAVNNITKSFEQSASNSASKQGYDITFATNFIGPVLLIELLTPILQDTSKYTNVRVVNIGSNAHLLVDGNDLRDKNVQKSSPFLPLAARSDIHTKVHWNNAYGSSKLALMMYTYHKQKVWNNHIPENKLKVSLFTYLHALAYSYMSLIYVGRFLTILQIFSVTPGLTSTGMVPKTLLAKIISASVMFDSKSATLSSLYAMMDPNAIGHEYYSNAMNPLFDTMLGKAILSILKFTYLEHSIIVKVLGGILIALSQKYSYGVHKSSLNRVVFEANGEKSADVHDWVTNEIRSFTSASITPKCK
jgi:NAD(P)-dependent dehydrogenase (short-subunit alcohol dehydrogenase family)